jgi:hypothetical protein
MVVDNMKRVSKGTDWLRCLPPGGIHTHKITSGLDVGIMRRILDCGWKMPHYKTQGERWCIGSGPMSIDILLVDGGWNENIKGD